LSGTYVFSSTGVDFTGGFLTAVGTLQADGKGGITGGVIDINGVDTGFSSTAITSGNYSITVDGRGQAKLNSATALANSFTIDFVLTSSSHGLVTEFDGNGTGSGTLDIQNTASLGNSYSFGFVGLSVSSGTPLAMAGTFTVDGAGNITAGITDINSNGFSSGGLNGLAVSGSVTAGSPGLATITTSAGTFNFDVYMIDAAHLKFIETDASLIVAGDAFTQQTSIIASTLAYTMAGIDVNTFPFVTGGFMTSDGASLISAGLQDSNDAGVVGTITGFAGSYTAFSGGRTVLTLNSVYNGNNGILSPTVIFAAYPSSGGVQLLEIDGLGTTSGVAYPQTSTTFASSQGYGLNLTAINGASTLFEEDDIAEFTATTSALTGLIDINDQGTLSHNQKFTGTYTLDNTIPGHGSASTNAFNYNFYVVNNSTVLILETDTVQLGTGSFQLQPGSQANRPALAVPYTALVRTKVASRAHLGWGAIQHKQ
jgi:hypothetical protein